MKVSGESFMVINTLLTAFSMGLAARIMHRKATGRLLLGAFLASIYALAAIMSGSSFLSSVPCCVLVVCLAALLAFKKENPYNRFRLTAFSLAAGLLLSGLTGFFFSHGMNAFLSAAVSGMLVMLGAVLLRAPAPPSYNCTYIEIGYNQMIFRVGAMIDSGNLLTDPITNLPVIVCSRRALMPLLPRKVFDEKAALQPGFRLISVRTAAGPGVMQVFTPQSLRVEADGIWREARAMIAIAPGAYDGMQALVPGAILEGGV